MNDMTPIAGIGHNGSPDPLDEALAPYAGALELAEGTLVGLPVETEAQMKAVDAIVRDLKEAKKAVEAAKEGEYRPFKAAGDAVIARYKPTLEDLDRQIKGCAAMVDTFKRRLAAEKAEAERKARAEADAKRRAAEDAARAAAADDLEAQRAAAAAQFEAEQAQRAAVSASKANDVKGLRAVTETIVHDELLLARHLWVNHRAEVTAFNADLARRLQLEIPGVVERHTERRAV